jgi:hypothetical protein
MDTLRQTLSSNHQAYYFLEDKLHPHMSIYSLNQGLMFFRLHSDNLRQVPFKHGNWREKIWLSEMKGI